MKKLFWRYSLPMAITKCFYRDTGNLTPFEQRKGFTVMRDKGIVSAVILLNKPISPTAIIRRIAEIAVDAVQSVFKGWARSHIGIEILKRIQPTITYGNTASSIARVRTALWISASPFHHAPDIVFAGLGHTVSDSALSDCIGSNLFLQTSATLSVSTNETATGNNGCISAFADNFPSCVAVAGISETLSATHDSPTAKVLTSHIDGTNNAICDRIVGHREPPKFSVTRVGTLARCRLTSFGYPIIVSQLFAPGKLPECGHVA